MVVSAFGVVAIGCSFWSDLVRYLICRTAIRLVAEMLQQSNAWFPAGWPFRDTEPRHVAKLFVNTTCKIRPDLISGDTGFWPRPECLAVAALATGLGMIRLQRHGDVLRRLCAAALTRTDGTFERLHSATDLNPIELCLIGYVDAVLCGGLTEDELPPEH